MINQHISLPSPKRGELKQGHVHIWHVSLASLDNHRSHLLTLLSQQERDTFERANHYQTHPPQLASKALLRLLLATYLHVDPHTLDIAHGPHGKPFLAHPISLQFSLSHTKTDAVFALTQQDAIGIDMETERTLTDHLDLAARFFSPTEYQYLQNLSWNDSKTAFIRLWTLKEAFVKAVGFGLSYPLADFTIDIEGIPPKIINKATIKEPSLAKDWQCFSWQADKSHMAVVVSGGPKTLYIDTLHIEQLL